jgi:hypothetical protein
MLNDELDTGVVNYDVQGIEDLCSRVAEKASQNEMQQVVDQYIPDLK